MTQKSIAIGVDDFKLLIDQGSYFVDKSLFIEKVIKDGSQVLLFPRPRRFGKTLNMSMLKYFFSHENGEENRQLFNGLAVTQSPVFEQHQGQYPVVFISLKELKSRNESDFITKIRQLISELFNSFSYLIEGAMPHSLSLDKEIFSAIASGKAENVHFEGGLKLLSRLLYHYHQKQTVILIDEYDTPIHEAYLHGFYDKAVGFLRILLGNALKGNVYLQKGVLTGILRVSKESMFSDLNNIMVYSLLKENYNTYFGFTQGEVDNLLKYYQLDQNDKMVKQWYNGYWFGNEEIYNPWSILNFAAHRGRFEAYWLGTSANELVHHLIKNSDNSVKKDIEDVLNNQPVYSVIDENISFQYLENTRENILSFFVQTGYLKARLHTFENNDLIYQIEIPNIELSKIYYKVIQLWFQESIGSSNLNEMLKALVNGDIELFEEILSSFVVSYLSYYQTSKDHIEKVYHAFVLGMLINLQDRYYIESERESGFGRVDILMTPIDKSKLAFVIEMKKIRVSETTQTALESALQQIEDRRYETLLRQQGCQNIIKLAVTFDGKRVWVKRGE